MADRTQAAKRLVVGPGTGAVQVAGSRARGKFREAGGKSDNYVRFYACRLDTYVQYLTVIHCYN